jgi:hypothetical protein
LGRDKNIFKYTGDRPRFAELVARIYYLQIVVTAYFRYASFFLPASNMLINKNNTNDITPRLSMMLA